MSKIHQFIARIYLNINIHFEALPFVESDSSRDYKHPRICCFSSLPLTSVLWRRAALMTWESGSAVVRFTTARVQAESALRLIVMVIPFYSRTSTIIAGITHSG